MVLFKDISYLELWRPLYSADGNHLYNFGRGYYEEQFYAFISNLGQWSRRCRLKYFYLGLWRPLCSVEWNHLFNFERGNHEEHPCEVIWNLVQEEMSFKEIVYRRLTMEDGRWMHNGWRLITIANLEPSAQVSSFHYLKHLKSLFMLVSF